MGWLERDSRHVWHPFTQHATEDTPLPVVGAEGAHLKLEDGRILVDAISSWWATLHGHGRKEIASAMAEQATRLDHVLFAGATHPGAVKLAERLAELAPGDLNRVFFSDDGSTAVEVALKMVLQRWIQAGEPERRVLVALEGGYHGDTFGAMAVGDPDPFFMPFAPLLFEVRRVPASSEALCDALDELGSRAAGLILEPLVQGAAGMQMHPPEFLREARAACDARGLPMIADEVMTGFGRTGTLFACDRAGIAPDVMCLAKGLTGGMFPMSVTLATEEIFSSFLSEDRARALFHGHTFTAHPVGCAAALASTSIVLEEDVPARFEGLGRALLERLGPIESHPAVSGLRRTGGIVAFDLSPGEGEPTGYLGSLAPRIRRMAIESGVLLRPLGNVVYAMPPACAAEEDLDLIAEAMRSAADLALR